jgi:dTDP-glucose pyrophosphorylase
MQMNKAVILARGLGTRMRREDNGTEMSPEQTAAAKTGVKAMMPIDRPFLDYVLHDLADAGCSKVCLVIGPEHDTVREYYASIPCERLQIDFAIQEKPLGTADAVAAAEGFADGDSVLVINSDNYYPLEALQTLFKLNGSGVAVFEREAMLAESNIAAERIPSFAVVKIDPQGYMEQIIEKPDEEILNQLAEPICLSMNCWRFGPDIFEACRKIEPSLRGELELPDAVEYTMKQMNQKYKVVVVKAAVLDMSYRSDVPAVAAKLKGKKLWL